MIITAELHGYDEYLPSNLNDLIAFIRVFYVIRHNEAVLELTETLYDEQIRDVI
jgi:hypothetical protein